MIRQLGVLASLVFVCANCSDAFGQGGVEFCMQWVNTSDVAVTFTATDDVGDQLSQVTLQSPGIGDAFASPLVKLSGAAPITFSANQGFQSVKFKPTGGNMVLLVEATRISTTLEHYEEAGQCQ